MAVTETTILRSGLFLLLSMEPIALLAAQAIWTYR